MDTEELGIQPRRLAATAIQKTHKEYTKPNGLRDLEKKVQAAEVNCSKHIYSLARYAFDNSDQPDGLFAALCVYAEEQFKARHNIENVKDALPVWAVFKSNINRGIKMELDPREYDSEWDFRKATMDELREANGGSTRAPRTPTGEASANDDKPSAVNVERVEDWVESTTIHTSLKFLVSRLVIEAEYIKKGKEKEAEAILREAIGALNKIIDRKRITDEATLAALEEAA